MRVSNFFAIFFLHPFRVRKTQILWKESFSKNPRWRLIFYIPAAILDFLKNFFSTKFASYQHEMDAKRRLQKSWILSESRQKI
jgi:hypothetical protein